MTDISFLKSFLAMDVYQRGYSFGIDLGGGITSENKNKTAGDFKVVLNSTIDLPTGVAESKGFYAIAYEYTHEVNGANVTEIVISYRGTDKFLTANGIGGDIINAYGAGADIATTAY